MSEPRFKSCVSCKWSCRADLTCSHAEVNERFQPSIEEIVVGDLRMSCCAARSDPDACGANATHWEKHEPLAPLEPVSRPVRPPAKIEETGSSFSPFWLGVGIAIGGLVMFVFMLLGGANS